MNLLLRASAHQRAGLKTPENQVKIVFRLPQSLRYTVIEARAASGGEERLGAAFERGLHMIRDSQIFDLKLESGGVSVSRMPTVHLHVSADIRTETERLARLFNQPFWLVAAVAVRNATLDTKNNLLCLTRRRLERRNTKITS